MNDYKPTVGDQVRYNYPGHSRNGLVGTITLVSGPTVWLKFDDDWTIVASTRRCELIQAASSQLPTGTASAAQPPATVTNSAVGMIMPGTPVYDRVSGKKLGTVYSSTSDGRYLLEDRISPTATNYYYVDQHTVTANAGNYKDEYYYSQGVLESLYGSSSTSDSEQRRRWKAEGRCEECGQLLPMSIWGLGECPSHPKPGGPQ